MEQSKLLQTLLLSDLALLLDLSYLEIQENEGKTTRACKSKFILLEYENIGQCNGGIVRFNKIRLLEVVLDTVASTTRVFGFWLFIHSGLMGTSWILELMKSFTCLIPEPGFIRENRYFVYVLTLNNSITAIYFL